MKQEVKEEEKNSTLKERIGFNAKPIFTPPPKKEETKK